MSTIDAVESLPAIQKSAAKKRRLKSAKQAKVIPDEDLYPKLFAGLEPPKTLYKNRRIGDFEVTDKWGGIATGVLHLAGVGSEKAEIMFVSPCTTWEEEHEGRSGLKPMMLKGPFGGLFKRNLGRAGIKTEDWFYTTLCKYTVPGLKPKAEDLRWNRAILLDEIRTVRPKIIVCLGKKVFDQFTELRAKMGDIQGGFFRSEEHDCLLYPMDTIQTPMMRPEYLERFVTDLKQVKRALDELRGVSVTRVTTVRHVLDTTTKIGNWVEEQLKSVPRNLAVDCEWHGQTYVGGRLRSLQASWKIGHACYIRFMDDALNYALDQPLPEVAKVLQPLLNHPDLKFVGHNFFADALWMRNHLGVQTTGRCAFDTLFAQHTLDEAADLKLERLAVKYTDLGRYDIPLLLWKKKHKFDEEHESGYGKVPDEILVPYANNDVDATLRIFPKLQAKLIHTKHWDYYRKFVLPFVTDGFTELAETGFPMNQQRLEEMRSVFTRNQGILLGDFQHSVDKEASAFLLEKLSLSTGSSDLFFELRELRQEHYRSGVGPSMESQEFEEALTLAKSVWSPETMQVNIEFFLHWWTAPGFNINSTDHLRRWLFAVKGFTPLKTTKKDGFQTSWERIAMLPKTKQAEYTPATDKQTIKLFAEKDPLVARIQELKGVGNIVKAFLKGPDEEGREQGLVSWIQPDGRIHPNYALTETARPRSWSPNVLNWTKNVTKPIEAAFKRANKIAAREHYFHIRKSVDVVEMRRQVKAIIQAPASIRSFVEAPPGWGIVDMDFKTAEVVQLAYVAGDANLIGVLTSPDTQFARIDPKNPKKYVRIAYNGLSAYPDSAKDIALLKPDDQRIMRDALGGIIHPLRDLHWELGETVMGGPRERMDEELVRGVGKVGNFCLAEGSMVLTDVGLIPIEKVTTCHKLWDGVAWVNHKGIKCNGVKTVRCYQGLWATDNHEVWVEDGRKVTFGEARTQRLELVRTQSLSGSPVRYELESVSGNHQKASGRLLQGADGVSVVWQAGGEGSSQYGERSFLEVSLSAWWLSSSIRGQTGLAVGCSLLSHGATLRTRQPCLINELQRARYKGPVRVASGVYSVGAGDVAECYLQEDGLRSYRQQWSLFERELTVGGSIYQSSKPEGNTRGEYRTCSEVYGGSSGGYLYGENHTRSASAGNDGSRATGASSNESKSSGLEETRSVKVYDILNVGPRHRFTCSGVLVSNSVPYGATDKLLERMVEVNTGRKPEEGTGQKIIDSYSNRYAVAWRFLEEMEARVTDPGWIRSTSGRVRHFSYTELLDVAGLSEYTRKGILSPLKRQARNFQIQEGVAATAARALELFLQKRKEMGLDVHMFSVLYDAMSILAPLAEIKAATGLLRDCMTTLNVWENHGRKWHHDVDVGYAIRWGCKPNAQEKELLAPYL